MDEAQRIDARVLRRFFRATTNRRNFGMRVSQAWQSGEFAFIAVNNAIGGTPNGLAIVRLSGAGFEHDLVSGRRVQLVPFTATETRFNGWRWWFLCTLSRPDGIACQRRSRVLFRPWNERLFGCRICHRLVYRSSQQHRLAMYEGLERPFRTWKRLSNDLASRSPRRRLRALVADPADVLRPMEMFGAPKPTSRVEAAASVDSL